MNDPQDPAAIMRQLKDLDHQLVEWLSQWLTQRGRVAQQLAEQGLTDPSRSATWLTDLAAGFSTDALRDEAFAGVLREIRCGLAAMQHLPRVVYLGPAFSFSHLAALTRFGSSAELLPVSSIAGVFEELRSGSADFGLAPLENSTDGRVADTLTCFARHPQRICGEVKVPIHHNLMSNSSREDITKVCSKPQALSQCRGWLARHMPQVEIVEMASTTLAASRAAEEPGCAAIASREAAAQYNVPILAANIEDNPNNVTRFAVIGDHIPEPTDHDKCSLMFELPNQPGALADAMQLFKSQQLNMTWIESFPVPNKEAEYLFFVEVDGNQIDANVQSVIEGLKEQTVRLEVLGSYPREM